MTKVGSLMKLNWRKLSNKMRSFVSFKLAKCFELLFGTFMHRITVEEKVKDKCREHYLWSPFTLTEISFNFNKFLRSQLINYVRIIKEKIIENFCKIQGFKKFPKNNFKVKNASQIGFISKNTCFTVITNL